MFVQRLFGIYCVILTYLKCNLADISQPKGHLQPLGSHRQPNVLDELLDLPTAHEFWTKYVKTSQAVVLRGAAKHSSGFQLWTDEYLIENYGSLEVRVEGKDEGLDGVPVGSIGLGRDTIDNFISHYHDSQTYIVSELPTPMWHDVNVPAFLSCGTFGDRLVEVDLWMSGGGSKSILHKDAFNALNCVYNGSKQWKMIEYKYENMIYKAWEVGNQIGGYSLINVSSVDLIKYPKFVNVPWSYVEINAGDCLFVPKSYYHQVNSFGSHNIAVAILFSRMDDIVDIENDGCDSMRYVSLSDLDVDWKYPGYGNMTMGNAEVREIKKLFLDLIDSDGNLTFELLVNATTDFLDGSRVKEDFLDGARVKEIFNFLAKENSSVIKREDVISMSRDELRILTLMVERYEPSNTYTHEYSYIPVDDIRMAIDRLIREDNAVIRHKFVKVYIEKLGGSEQFANQIFDSFETKGNDKATIKEVLHHLDSALKPYIEYATEFTATRDQQEPIDNEKERKDEENDFIKKDKEIFNEIKDEREVNGNFVEFENGNKEGNEIVDEMDDERGITSENVWEFEKDIKNELVDKVDDGRATGNVVEFENDINELFDEIKDERGITKENVGEFKNEL